jgi:hypothetical protein
LISQSKRKRERKPERNREKGKNLKNKPGDKK